MFETVWFVYLVLALLTAGLLFPRLGHTMKRWGKGLFYGSALLAILGWTLLKSVFVLFGRRLLGSPARA